MMHTLSPKESAFTYVPQELNMLKQKFNSMWIESLL